MFSARFAILAALIVSMMTVGCVRSDETQMEALLKESSMQKSAFEDMTIIGSGIRKMHRKNHHDLSDITCLCKMFAKPPDKFGITYKIYGQKVLSHGRVCGVVDSFERSVSFFTNHVDYGKCSVNTGMEVQRDKTSFLIFNVIYDAVSCEFRYEYPQ